VHGYICVTGGQTGCCYCAQDGSFFLVTCNDGGWCLTLMILRLCDQVYSADYDLDYDLDT